MSFQATQFTTDRFIAVCGKKRKSLFGTAMLLAHYSHGKEGDSIWCSIDTMARLTGRDRRTIQRDLRALEKAGWLACVRPPRRGPNRPTVYRIAPMAARPDNVVNRPANSGTLAALTNPATAALATNSSGKTEPQRRQDSAQEGGVDAARSIRNQYESIKESGCEDEGERATPQGAPANGQDGLSKARIWEIRKRLDALRDVPRLHNIDQPPDPLVIAQLEGESK